MEAAQPNVLAPAAFGGTLAHLVTGDGPSLGFRFVGKPSVDHCSRDEVARSTAGGALLPGYGTDLEGTPRQNAAEEKEAGRRWGRYTGGRVAKSPDATPACRPGEAEIKSIAVKNSAGDCEHTPPLDNNQKPEEMLKRAVPKRAHEGPTYIQGTSR